MLVRLPEPAPHGPRPDPGRRAESKRILLPGVPLPGSQADNGQMDAVARRGFRQLYIAGSEPWKAHRHPGTEQRTSERL